MSNIDGEPLLEATPAARGETESTRTRTSEQQPRGERDSQLPRSETTREVTHTRPARYRALGADR